MADSLDSLVPLQASSSPSEHIAAQLRERIIDGTFDFGEHLYEAHLAARFNVSRGPVREAVQRLVQEGFLVSNRNRGTSVVEFSHADVMDIYRARLAIEREAARVLFEAGTSTVIDKLDAIYLRMTEALTEQRWSDLARHDIAFHQTIVDAAGSPRLSKMFSTLAGHTLLCVRRYNSVWNSDIKEQHGHLRDLLEAGDATAYLEEIDSHLLTASRRFTGALES